MIKSFKHKGLERFFYSGTKKGIKPDHASKLERILDRLNAANDLKGMNYPGSGLHSLSGDRKGQHSVKVTGNWRLIFEFINGDEYIVDYDDYHYERLYEKTMKRQPTHPGNILKEDYLKPLSITIQDMASIKQLLFCKFPLAFVSSINRV